MGRAQIFFYCNRNRPLQISLMFLLVSSHILLSFTADGRPSTELLETTNKGVNEEKMLVRAQTIGSRPPQCETRCSSCGHCEAVQVPVAAQSQNHQISHQWRRTSHLSASSVSSVVINNYSRGDYVSNYKPVCWKCKCGDFIFNP